MRKGFTLTLTALVTAFMVTSAVAMGPTIGQVPDVYIGPEAAAGAPAEPGTNMFRYSNALTLWDYVTVGATSGAGSTSDTLYWQWAAKSVDDTLAPIGSFLASSSVHYSITQGNDVVVAPLTPTIEVGQPGWGEEINAALTALGGSLPDYALNVSGQLTFRNIRLSPLPDDVYSTPTADPTAPIGYLEAQEATLYVSDNVTTDLGTDQILLLTVETGPDALSGGPVWSVEQDYTSDSSAFGGAFTFNAAIASALTPITTPAPGVTTSNNNAGTLTVTVPSGDTTTFNYIQFLGAPWPLGTPADAANLYRLKATLASGNANAANNPHVLLGMNALGDAGYGFVQVLAGNGPSASTGPKTYSGYLKPVEAGTPQLIVAVFDPANFGTSTFSGTYTVNNIVLQSVAFSELSGGTPLITVGTFDAANLFYLALGYGGLTSPVFSRTPASGSAGTMSLGATTNNYTVPPTSGTAQQGFASLNGEGYTYVPSDSAKLIVVAVNMSASAATGNLPKPWLNVEQFETQIGMLWKRNPAGSNLPGTTAQDFYAVYESTEDGAGLTSGKFNFRIIADFPNASGSVIVDQWVATEYDIPAEP